MAKIFGVSQESQVIYNWKETLAAFDILRSEYKAQGITDIDAVCPYRVYMEMEDINGIEVRILDENGKELLTLRDIKDVNQLKIALDRLPADKRKIAHVSIKANKDTPMEEITAVKQVLREYHILQLNMEVNKTILKNVYHVPTPDIVSIVGTLQSQRVIKVDYKSGKVTLVK